MPQTLSALFVSPDAAEKAIGALEDHGIDAERISVAAADSAPAITAESDADEFMEVETGDPPTPTDMNAVTEARLGGYDEEVSIVEAEGKHGITTTTAADAAKGAAEGGVLGLGIGLIAGVTALMVPGVGAVLAAGPLWAALGGALGTAAAGAVAGGVTGYLRDMGVPESEAARYAEAIGRGSVLVSVHADTSERMTEMKNILIKYGGTGISVH